MALYKVEYWVQDENDEQPEMRYSDIYYHTCDRSMKSYITKREKFYPEFSTPWKQIGDEPDFESWSRSIKQSTLKKWRDEHLTSEQTRFVIIRKALTANSNGQLEKECDYMPTYPYRY